MINFGSMLSLWLLLSTSFMKVNGLNSKVDKKCVSFDSGAGVYEKISPSSKYLVLRRNSKNPGSTGVDSRNFCNIVGQIEQAEVTSKFDLQSLERNLFERVWIGINRDSKLGIFVNARGKPIKFQSFVGMEPNNLDMNERCVMLVPDEGGFLTMQDAPCSSINASALCQFKRGSSCFLQSAEVAALSSAEKDSDVINLAVGSRFYVSRSQKPWNVAYESCLTNGLQLLTLENKGVNQELTDQIKRQLAEQHLHPATQFWTAGSLEESTERSGFSLSWFVGQEGSIPASSSIPHKWAKATPDIYEPFDQSGSGAEACLDISFENMEKEPAGSNSPNWRASDCFLPKFFICEKVSYGIPEDVIRKIIKEQANVTQDGLEGRFVSGREIQSCGDLHVDPINFQIDITRPQTEEDIIKFLIFNIEHDLKSGTAPYEIKPEIKWKETVLDLLIQIVQKAVNSAYVDHGLLNVVKVVLLMYFNAIPITANTTKNEKLWAEVYIPHLEKCLDDTQKLSVTGNGFEIGYYTTESGDMEDIQVPEEYADKIENLDSAIDIFWYLFSFSLASCYALPKDKVVFASDFHVIFIADFIHELREKWTINVETVESKNSLGLDYSLALGDFDFLLTFRNLRYLVTAAYIKSNIEELQLVRPLDTSLIVTDFSNVQQNTKTGNTLSRR